MNFKLTTECGFRWDWDHVRYWPGGYKPRPLYENDKKIGVAFGPVMFFWKWK
jgi:hypothetical protein